jgi:hypothetical protein
MIKLILLTITSLVRIIKERACTKNGIYETISFGKSEKVPFENFGFKGGILLKFQASNH